MALSASEETRWAERRSGREAQADDARTPFDTDYARVVHSGSFRRLQGKTQILINLGDGDFYRTRLTHSLEVAQIGSGIVLQLRKAYKGHACADYLPSTSLIQTIGLAHDLGHPPFGHGGEVALNYCMRDNGGFEGNGHTLRILSKLENFSDGYGADLTRRCLLGVIKYPVSYQMVADETLIPTLEATPTAVRIINRKTCKPPKCYFDTEKNVLDWILAGVSPADAALFTSFDKEAGKHGKSRYKSFDCSIMEMADDIAYGVHDLEDALALGLIKRERFQSIVPKDDCTPFLNDLREKYPDECGNDAYAAFLDGLFGEGGRRKRFIGRLVHHFLTHIHVETNDAFQEPLLRYNVTMPDENRRFLNALKDVVFKEVILSPNVHHLVFKGQNMVVAVFEALTSDPALFLPRDARERFDRAHGDWRVLCDYVAGMTDAFLLKTYERLFSPRMGSVFDRL